MDNHANFAEATIVVAPDPADSGTELTVDTGQGAWFKSPPFNCTVVEDGISTLPTTAEIVRVTDITGDVLTIIREQEGTTAQPVDVGWKIFNSATEKVFTDLETAIEDLTPGSIYYVHDQISSNTTWTISHNLGKFPNVTVVDSAGTVVEGSIEYQDSNTIVITFSAPFGGKAYLT